MLEAYQVQLRLNQMSKGIESSELQYRNKLTTTRFKGEYSAEFKVILRGFRNAAAYNESLLYFYLKICK